MSLKCLIAQDGWRSCFNDKEISSKYTVEYNFICKKAR